MVNMSPFIGFAKKNGHLSKKKDKVEAEPPPPA
jgi:hypothetical protein